MRESRLKKKREGRLIGGVNSSRTGGGTQNKQSLFKGMPETRCGKKTPRSRHSSRNVVGIREQGRRRSFKKDRRAEWKKGGRIPALIHQCHTPGNQSRKKPVKKSLGKKNLNVQPEATIRWALLLTKRASRAAGQK